MRARSSIFLCSVSNRTVTDFVSAFFFTRSGGILATAGILPSPRLDLNDLILFYLFVLQIRNTIVLYAPWLTLARRKDHGRDC